MVIFHTAIAMQQIPKKVLILNVLFFVRLTMMNHQKAPSTIPYFPQRGSQLFDPFFLKLFIAQEPQQRVKFG